MVPRSKKGTSREGRETGRQEGKGSGGAKKRAAASQEEGKPPQKPSRQGATQEARERAAGLAPSDSARVIAADPLRAQIVAVALQRLYSPSEFAKDAGVALNVASYAFKVLKDHGILELVKEEQVRGATIKHMYRATEAAFVNEADWGQLAEAFRPGLVGTTLRDFANRVTQAMETGHLFTREDFYLYWAPEDSMRSPGRSRWGSSAGRSKRRSSSWSIPPIAAPTGKARGASTPPSRSQPSPRPRMRRSPSTERRQRSKARRRRGRAKPGASDKDLRKPALWRRARPCDEGSSNTMPAWTSLPAFPAGSS